MQRPDQCHQPTVFRPVQGMQAMHPSISDQNQGGVRHRLVPLHPISVTVLTLHGYMACTGWANGGKVSLDEANMAAGLAVLGRLAFTCPGVIANLG